MKDIFQDNKTMEIVTIAASASFLGMVGWIGHVLAVMKDLDYKRFVGGILFAGFTSSISCLLMLATDTNPLFAAPLSAMVGASGEYGFNFMLERWLSKRK